MKTVDKYKQAVAEGERFVIKETQYKTSKGIQTSVRTLVDVNTGVNYVIYERIFADGSVTSTMNVLYNSEGGVLITDLEVDANEYSPTRNLPKMRKR